MATKHYQNTHKLELVKRGSYAALLVPELLVLNKRDEIMLVMGGEKETPAKNYIDYLQESKLGTIKPTQREKGDVLSGKAGAVEKRNHYVLETEKRDEVFTVLAHVNQLKPDLKDIRTFEEDAERHMEAMKKGQDVLMPVKPAHLHDLVLAWDGDLTEAIYRTLDDAYNTPFIKEWTPYIIKQLKEKDLLEELRVYSFGEKEHALQAALIKTSIVQLREIITEGIQSMDLEFFVYEAVDEEDKLSNIREVSDYITSFGPELAKLIQESVKVDFDPAVDRHHPVLIDMNLHANQRGVTGYYPPQANTMMGLARTLQRDSFGFLIGEMGAGKSAMGAGLPYVAQAIEKNADAIERGLPVEPARVFVLSPAIMVHKWKREIEDRVPGVQVHILENWLDAKKLRDRTSYMENGKRKFRKPETMEYYIMSSEAPKVSLPEEPIRDWRYAPSTARRLRQQGQKANVRFGTQAVFNPQTRQHDFMITAQEEGYYCPKCGKPILKKIGSGRNTRYEAVSINHFGGFDRKTEEFKDQKKVENTYCKSTIPTKYLPKEEIEKWTFNKAANRYEPKEDEQVCNYNLWQTKKNLSKGMRKVSPAWYINKYFPRGFFKYLIADEVHEYKGGRTKIGQAFGQLVNHTEKQILLTGTLFGGMARDIFYLLARLAPSQLQREDLNFETESRFNALYGVFETTYGNAERRMNPKRTAKPGISPHLFPMYLMGNAAFLELNDMGYALPPYREIPKIIPMDGIHENAYNRFSEEFMSQIKDIDTLKGMASVSTYINMMYQYADTPRNFPEIHLYDQDGVQHFICEPDNLDDNYTPAKLRELHNTIDAEIEKGRKNLVYVKYTGKNSFNRMDTQLYNYFKDLGYNVGILCNDSSYDGIKMPKSSTMREEWLNQMMAEHDWDILITNPRLVKVGLDLLAFPNIHFYQLDYSTFDYMQASRRSWRIRQTEDVQVFTYVYQDTIQDKALRHIARKIDASLAMQGKFSEEGLRAMSEASDGMNALAKELIANDALVDSLDESVHDIFARKNQSFEEMQSVEFQEYEFYIMNPIEGGIEKVREIANSLLDQAETLFAEGKVTKEFVKAARETVDNYMAAVLEFTSVVANTKDVNKGVSKANRVVEGQVAFDLFGDE